MGEQPVAEPEQMESWRVASVSGVDDTLMAASIFTR